MPVTCKIHTNNPLHMVYVLPIGADKIVVPNQCATINNTWSVGSRRYLNFSQKILMTGLVLLEDCNAMCFDANFLQSSAKESRDVAVTCLVSWLIQVLLSYCSSRLKRRTTNTVLGSIHEAIKIKK